MKLKTTILIISTTLFFACQSNTSNEKSTELKVLYTKDIEDQKAAELVSTMMDAMGGSKEWEGLKYVSWTFFGARHLVWDKMNNRVRIESPKDSSIYLVNLNDGTGKYAYNGQETLKGEKLVERLKRGKSIWINDMYWLFMPFKLYDQGVTVKYLGSDTTLIGVKADVLELTFDQVGNTPENKYEVFVDAEEHLIKQWRFFKEAKQDTASRTWPWDNYKDHNGLMLSSERTDSSGPSNVRVYDYLDDKVFTSFEPFSFY